METKKYTKDYFELVDDKERLLDKPLETKQLSYFQDAFVRFSKNKYNVAATIILILLILLSIVVPIVTPDRLYKQTNSELSTLPPRIPIIEKLGILNGRKTYKNQPIDLSTVDPDTGLGYPTKGFDPQYINFKSLKNQEIYGSDKTAQFVGGTNEIIVTQGSLAYAVRSNEKINFSKDFDLKLSVNSIGNGYLKLYLSTSSLGSTVSNWNDLPLLGQISTNGEHTLNFVNRNDLTGEHYLIAKYEVREVSATDTNVISLNSIEIETATKTYEYDGYTLSRFLPFIVSSSTESGRYTRLNNDLIIAPDKKSYAVSSDNPVVISGETSVVFNVAAIDEGVATVYLTTSNDSNDYTGWMVEEEEMYQLGTISGDGQYSFSPQAQEIEPGQYHIVIKLTTPNASNYERRIALDSIELITGETVIEITGTNLSEFSEFIFDEENEEGSYLLRNNEIVIFQNRQAYTIASNTALSLTNESQFEVNINAIGDGVAKVYLSPKAIEINENVLETLTLVGEINASGTHTLSSSEIIAGDYYVVIHYVANEVSATEVNTLEIDSIEITTGATEVLFETNELAKFLPFFASGIERGRYNRRDAKMITASFEYDVYGALFSAKRRLIGKEEYDRILAENDGMAEAIILDPENNKAWTFEEGYPLIAVTNYHPIVIGGIEYSTYEVLMDGAYATGFTSTPYFYFGTDIYGRDLFTLIWLGLRTSLLLGFLASIVNIIVGVIWGATSAYYGGQVDILMERFLDIWGSFPQITMIGIISVLVGPGFLALFIFMIYDGWLGAASITRIQFYRYKGREYVLAARTLGASDRRLIFKHILPNALGTIVTRVILSIPAVIFLEVNLSYLGFGIGSGQTLKIGPIELTGSSIGVILNEGQQQILAGNLWLIVAPMLVVSILMITFNMFGNALRDALNPQLRGN